MLKKFPQKGIRLSIMLVLILGVIACSLITDVPFPTEEAPAWLKHKCCQIQCVWDPDAGEWVHFNVCNTFTHWKIWNHGNPC